MSKKEKKEKEKKEFLKFADFPQELKTYFYQKMALAAGLLIGLVIFAIFSKMIKASLILGIFLLIYVGYIVFQGYECAAQKVYVYRGIFESKKIKSLGTKKKDGTPGALSISGPCSIILKSPDNDEIKYVVPVGSGFDAAPGNEIVIYTKQANIHKQNGNSFFFDDPMLVKVSKI